MKRIVLLLSLLIASSTAHAVSWADLWWTPEQQAQRLLASGKSADAASKFKDPRRRAYAEIEAGQYPEAAQLLESLSDPQSQYNRGNALAQAGQLENALAAYDNAIKQTTAESALGRDARHNRELVSEQLKKQQPSRSNSGSQSDKQQSGNDQSSDQDQRQTGDQSQTGLQDQSDAANKDQQGKSGQEQSTKESAQSLDQNSKASQGQQSSAGEAIRPESAQRDASTSGSDKGKHDALAQRDATASGTEKQKQEAADAQRDAAAAMSKPEQRYSNGMNGQLAQDDSTDRTNTSAATQERPLSEQALSLDQWLRQIPDDPAGLLRRKFLIEHLRRQQAQAESR